MRLLNLAFGSLLACLLCSTSYAWREGNGGDVVVTNKGLYLLDLFEAGIEDKADITVFLQNSFFRENLLVLENNLGEKLPITYLESKFQQIYLKNSTLSLALLQALNELSWKFVSFPLKDVQDEGPNLSIPRSELIQAAFRVNQTVQIHKGTWNMLDKRNQAALILHEILYSLMKPERDAQGMDMNSPRVRVLIGYLFSSDLTSKPIRDYLASEAPHLNFPASVNPQIDPVKNSSGNTIIFNRQWYAKIPTTAGSEDFEQIPLSSNLIPQWVEYICQRASQEKSAFRFGLQGEKVSCSLEKIGTGGSEEFYVLPEYQWPATLSVIEISRPENSSSGLDNCKKEIANKMNWLTFQALN